MAERLQKLMAQAGIASRREAESIIEQGRVLVNGERAKVGDKADPTVDDIRIDGSRLHIEAERVYIIVHKPMGIVTAVTAQSQERRRTVRDLVPVPGHLYPVGRLDADSEGLVLLTSDGELAQKLTHPRYQHPKVYDVALTGNVSDEALDIWRRGIVLDDGPTKPVEIKVLTRDKDLTWVRVTMREGRKRQIRRIGTTLGYPVRHLVRIQLDTLALGALKVGEWRYLTETEIKTLQQSAASSSHHGKTLPEGERSTRSSTSHGGSRSRSATGSSRGAGTSHGTRSGTRQGTSSTTRRRTPTHVDHADGEHHIEGPRRRTSTRVDNTDNTDRQAGTRRRSPASRGTGPRRTSRPAASTGNRAPRRRPGQGGNSGARRSDRRSTGRTSNRGAGRGRSSR